MKSVQITIEGISPLLMHKYPMTPIEALEKKTPQEQAELALYSNGDGPYVPGIGLQRAMIAGAAYSKGKGRASLAKVVAACVLVSPEYLRITEKWEIDSRPVVIPSTKGRVMRHRPRFNTWHVSAEISYDETLLTREQLHRVLTDTGQRVGLLDFRPEKKGPFGRFQVTIFS